MTATAALVLTCGACTIPIGVPEQESAPTPVPAPAPSEATSSVARYVTAAVNGARHANGLAPLEQQEALARAAQGHAEELAERRTLDHNSTDPARRTMTMRIEAAGATWLRAAENLASMSGTASAVPAQTVRMWLGSDGHRRNMLSQAYTHTGVGVAIDRRGIWYVTQLYVLPRADR
ncbi:MAG TPA: CAP domain-containing protein [Longimicrobiales bacterium]